MTAVYMQGPLACLKSFRAQGSLSLGSSPNLFEPPLLCLQNGGDSGSFLRLLWVRTGKNDAEYECLADSRPSLNASH